MLNTVSTAKPVLVAWHGSVGAEGDQWLWKVYSKLGCPSLGPITSYSGNLSFGAASCGFHWHWDDIGTRQLLHIVNGLVFCDQFMRHIMAYVTPDQMAKTVAKFLWQFSDYWPNFWVTKELTLRATSPASCLSSWASGRQEVCLTTSQTNGLMDMTND